MIVIRCKTSSATGLLQHVTFDLPVSHHAYVFHWFHTCQEGLIAQTTLTCWISHLKKREKLLQTMWAIRGKAAGDWRESHLMKYDRRVVCLSVTAQQRVLRLPCLYNGNGKWCLGSKWLQLLSKQRHFRCKTHIWCITLQMSLCLFKTPMPADMSAE